MHWEEYGEGLRTKTEFGTYTIGPTRCGWWVSFHCLCCRQFTQVVPMDSQLERCKTKAVEHHEGLAKRYAEATQPKGRTVNGHDLKAGVQFIKEHDV